MKWGIAFITLLVTVAAQAGNNAPLTLALNEADQFAEQRQAAVERLKKLIEMKAKGITPTADMPEANVKHLVVKPAPAVVEKPLQPEPVKQAKAETSKRVVEQKQQAEQRKKVVVAAWGDNQSNSVNGDNTSIPAYSRKFAGVMKRVVNSTKNAEVVRTLSWQTAKKVNFSTDDVAMSKRLCNANQADTLFFGILEAGEAGGARRHPDTTFMKFDCAAGQMVYFTTSMDQHINDPAGFMFKTTLREKFQQFVSGEVQL